MAHFVRQDLALIIVRMQHGAPARRAVAEKVVPHHNAVQRRRHDPREPGIARYAAAIVDVLTTQMRRYRSGGKVESPLSSASSGAM